MEVILRLFFRHPAVSVDLVGSLVESSLDKFLFAELDLPLLDELKLLPDEVPDCN